MAVKSERLRHIIETYGPFMVSIIYMSMLIAGVVNLCLAVALPIQFPEIYSINIMRPWATAFTVWLSSYMIGTSASYLLIANIRYARVGREQLRVREYQNGITMEMLSVSRWTAMSGPFLYLLMALCCYWHIFACPCYSFGVRQPQMMSLGDHSHAMRVACLRLTKSSFLVTILAALLQMAAITISLTAAHIRKIKLIKAS